MPMHGHIYCLSHLGFCALIAVFSEKGFIKCLLDLVSHQQGYPGLSTFWLTRQATCQSPFGQVVCQSVYLRRLGQSALVTARA